MSNNTTQDNKSFDCPTCEREFDTQRGMRSHHSQTHGVRLGMVEVECDHCGGSVEKHKSDVGNGKNYCNRECEGKAKSDNKTYHLIKNCENCGDLFMQPGGFIHHTRKYCSHKCRTRARNKQVSKEHQCDYCGVDMQVQPNRLEKREHVFCGNACHSKWMGENKTGERNNAWKGGKVELICKNCGEKYEKKPAVAEGSKFCSYECLGEASGKIIQERYSGSDHWDWNGGKEDYYGPTWQRQREKRIQLDGEQCVVCGMSKEEHKDAYSKDLEVHHIRPIKTFDNYEIANELDNLRTMCVGCHRHWEGIPIVPQ